MKEFLCLVRPTLPSVGDVTSVPKMKTTLHVGLVIGIMCCVDHVMACSCPSYRGTDHEQAALAYGESGSVFVAKLISTQHLPCSEDSSSSCITEEASFEVAEVLKGNYKIGDIISTKSDIGVGLCGISALNNPASTLIFDVNNKDITSKIVFSKEWLIYVDPDRIEPFELSLCSRSSPISMRMVSQESHADARGGRDLNFLRKFIKKYGLNDG